MISTNDIKDLLSVYSDSIFTDSFHQEFAPYKLRKFPITYKLLESGRLECSLTVFGKTKTFEHDFIKVFLELPLFRLPEKYKPVDFVYFAQKNSFTDTLKELGVLRQDIIFMKQELQKYLLYHFDKEFISECMNKKFMEEKDCVGLTNVYFSPYLLGYSRQTDYISYVLVLDNKEYPFESSKSRPKLEQGLEYLTDYMNSIIQQFNSFCKNLNYLYEFMKHDIFSKKEMILGNNVFTVHKYEQILNINSLFENSPFGTFDILVYISKDSEQELNVRGINLSTIIRHVDFYLSSIEKEEMFKLVDSNINTKHITYEQNFKNNLDKIVEILKELVG